MLVATLLLLRTDEGWGDVTKERIARSGRLAIANQCVLATDSLTVHLLLPVRYSTSSLGAVTMKYVYQFWCDTELTGCYGIEMKIDQLEKKKPISFGDLNRINRVKAQLPSPTKWLLSWGLDTMKMSVDFQTGLVTYTESNGATQSRGEARCQVMDIRRCTTDQGCIPQWECSGERCIPREPFR